MAYIVIADNDDDVKDMFENKKAAAYLPYTGPRIDKDLKNEKFFIYRTKKNSTPGVKTGIIAYGTANGKEVPGNRCDSGKDAHNVNLDDFTVLETPMSFAEVKRIYDMHYDNKFVLVNVTVKRVKDDFAVELIEDIKRRCL